MNNTVKNIDSWVGRVLIILFFLFVLSFPNSNNNCSSELNSISTEQTAKIDNYAILGKTINFSNYNNSVYLGIYNLNAGDLKIEEEIFNNTVIQQFKHHKLLFYKIKPKLHQLHFIHQKIFSGKDYSLIS